MAEAIWSGFLAETLEPGKHFDKTYWKTPLWHACLELGTDDMVEARAIDAAHGIPTASLHE